jgi:hypothetical protein
VITPAGGVSIIRFNLSGTGGIGTGVFSDPDTFGASDDIAGSLRAFAYPTRTLIETVSFTDVEATSSGGDVNLMGEGTAMVNGMLTDIAFSATKTQGEIAFEIFDAETSKFLAGGTGEPGRATLELTITPL